MQRLFKRLSSANLRGVPEERLSGIQRFVQALKRRLLEHLRCALLQREAAPGQVNYFGELSGNTPNVSQTLNMAQ